MRKKNGLQGKYYIFVAFSALTFPHQMSIEQFKEGSTNRNDEMPILPLNGHFYIV